jgi:hypothetical protein
LLTISHAYLGRGIPFAYDRSGVSETASKQRQNTIKTLSKQGVVFPARKNVLGAADRAGSDGGSTPPLKFAGTTILLRIIYLLAVRVSPEAADRPDAGGT